MNIEKIEDHYKMKFHNLFVRHFLPLTGGYDLQKDYECMHRLIRGGTKIVPGAMRFALLTQEQNKPILYKMLCDYEIFAIIQMSSDQGFGYIVIFPLTQQNIKELKNKRSSTQQQKQIKQLIINCYRAFKKTSEN